MPNNSTPVRILQITDTHLFADRRASLHGINTHESLQSILRQACQQPKPELVLITGDLAQDGSKHAYRRLFKMLKQLDAPTGVIAGNHDDMQVLRTELPKTFRLGGVHLLGAWRAVLLNSQLPGQPGGHLDNAELYFLNAALEAAGDRHVLIVLHHHPVPIGSAWLDRIALDNPEPLFALLKRFPNVHAVLCGHVHQELDVQVRGLRVLATPSSCVQFLPRSPEFAADSQPPGLRWLTLKPDGSIETEVQRAWPGSMHRSSAPTARA